MMMNSIKCPHGVLNKDFEKIIEVHERIMSDYSKPIPSVKDLSETTNMSSQKFRLLFQKIFQNSYYQYYHQIRLEYAKSLLIENEFTIVQIAYKIGFYHSQNFARAFLKYTGMTAKEFRNIYSK
jgi:AraC-like DNA-binding protein